MVSSHRQEGAEAAKLNARGYQTLRQTHSKNTRATHKSVNTSARCPTSFLVADLFVIRACLFLYRLMGGTSTVRYCNTQAFRKAENKCRS
jgi:hypothetical protein